MLAEIFVWNPEGPWNTKFLFLLSYSVQRDIGQNKLVFVKNRKNSSNHKKTQFPQYKKIANCHQDFEHIEIFDKHLQFNCLLKIGKLLKFVLKDQILSKILFWWIAYTKRFSDLVC